MSWGKQRVALPGITWGRLWARPPAAVSPGCEPCSAACFPRVTRAVWGVPSAGWDGAAPVPWPCTSLDWPGERGLALGSRAVLAFLLLQWITRNFGLKQCKFISLQFGRSESPWSDPKAEASPSAPGMLQECFLPFPRSGGHAALGWGPPPPSHLVRRSQCIVSIAGSIPPITSCLCLPALWECFWLSCDYLWPTQSRTSTSAEGSELHLCQVSLAHWSNIAGFRVLTLALTSCVMLALDLPFCPSVLELV